MKDDLIMFSRDIQIAFNKAVSTQDEKDWDEYNRLEDEYCIKSNLHHHKKFKERLEAL